MGIYVHLYLTIGQAELLASNVDPKPCSEVKRFSLLASNFIQILNVLSEPL